MVEKNVVALFEEQVRKFPFSIAVIEGEVSITYRDLNKSANQLAHYLISRGVQSETIISICAERSISLIIGILATLKAGGTYCPLDPNYPIERIKYMLQDTGSPIILTQTKYLEQLPATDSIIICLDDLPPTVSLNSISNPTVSILPEDLAYVMYTSGSSGVPKGVMIEHGSIVNLVSEQKYVKFLPDYSIMHFANISFDISTFEIWGSLLNGCQLIVIFHQGALDLGGFKKIIRQNPNPGVILSTSLYEEIISTMPDFFMGCRFVIFGGEVCNPRKISDYINQADAENLPDVTINAYGPTETTTLVTYYIVNRGTDYTAVPIGMPILNVGVEIFDPELNEVKKGDIGEIYISGASLARGYLNRIALTQEKFVDIRGGRYYRTGDLAKLLEDNNIEFQGRADNQVKIRGYRVELEEIEATLWSISDVENAVVRVETSPTAEKSLSAYITIHKHLIRVIYEGKAEIKWQDGSSQFVEVADVSQGGICLLNVKRICKVPELVTIKLGMHNNDAEMMGEVVWQSDSLIGVHFLESYKSIVDFIDSYYERKCTVIPQRRNLKALLEKKLPKYMMPDKFVVLSSLPLTANGKIDRNALASIEIQSKDEPKVKTTENEEILMQLWREVLSISKISPSDDFFSLGGDALLVTKVISKLKDQYNINITYDQFFENPSLSALSAFIGSQIQTSHFNPIPIVSRHQLLNLSISQKRIWFLNQFFSDVPLFNITHYAVIEGAFDVEILMQAVAELMKRHEILSSCFSVSEDGEPFQRKDEVTKSPMEFSNDLLSADKCDDDIQPYLKSENSYLFDLNVSPLFRILVMRVADNRTALIFTFHKIISDETSIELFYRDLLEVYVSIVEKRNARLPALPIQYVDYAYWQNAQLNDESKVYQDLVQFWKNHLQGAPHELDLPSDHSRAGGQNFIVDNYSLVLSNELLEPLRQLSVNTGSTLHMTLYASFICLLFMLTGKRDMVLGMPVPNRTQSETENVLGPFKNLLPVRTSFSPTTIVEELLDEIKFTLLNCYQYQDMRFEKLLEIVESPTHSHQHPLFQIVFSYFKRNDTKVEQFSMFNIEDQSVPCSFSFFDLAMKLEERDKQIVVSFQYAVELFEVSTIHNWADLWKTLISIFAKDPKITLQELSRTCLSIFDKSIVASHESKAMAHNKVEMPQTKTEKAIYQIWSEALKRHDFTVFDSFFQLGGHSLLLIQVISKIKIATGKLIPVKVFFEYPTIKALAEYIENQSDVKRQEIQHLSYPSEIPLSHPQERLWFIEKLVPNNPVNNLPFVFRISGKLSIQHLKEAIDKITQKYEILRTEFKSNDEGKPYQKILSKLSVPVEIISSMDGSSDKVIETLLILPFNLEKAPLFRVTVFKYSPEEFHLVIVFHQSIADPVSIKHFFNELEEFYGAPNDAAETNLKPPIQYADYSIHQRNTFNLDNSHFATGLGFWKNYLQDVPSQHDSPLDFERPIVHRFQGKRVYFALSSDISKKIKNLSLLVAGSDFSVLISFFYMFLNKISLQEDIVVATPVTGRPHPELEKLIGFFVNILPLRAKVNPSITVMDFIYSIKESTSKAFEYQHIPYEKILTVSDVRRAVNHEPLSQILFVLQNLVDERLQLPHLKIEREPFEFPVSKYDLSMHIEEREGLYKGYLEYDTQIFSEETIKKWKDRWLTLVQSAVNEPQAPICQLRILSGEEEQKILVDWNDTVREYPAHTSFYDMFSKEVAHLPDSIAIELTNQSLSYFVLDQRINKLAKHLHHSVPQSNPIIGIICDRSFELIISVLAVMRMGGAFLVLDPELPVDRLKYMIEDSKVDLIITNKAFISLVPTDFKSTFIIDSFFDGASVSDTDNLEFQKVDLSLSYIAYTSGTTGKPKGVMIDEFALVDRLQWWKENIPLDKNEIFLNLFTLSFDAGIASLLWPLTCGASVLMPPYETLANPEAIAELIIKKNVTVLVGTPSLLNIVLNEPRLKHSRLRKIIFAGEDLSLTVLEKARRISNAAIYNFYGPTECTIIATFSKILPLQNTVTIGRPVSNVKIYILDKFMKPVPIGMIGEIYIGGVGVSRGYVSQPRLTESSFITSPFVLGEKLYQTGDLGLWRENGEIEFKGRKDNQIKIKGHRVELEEVESVIRAVEGVQNTAVIFENNKIIAFVVSALPTNQVRNEIARFLPHYAMPDKIIYVNEIPVASNGKLNRKAIMKHSSFQDIVLPRTNTEKQLASIFRNILNRDNFSVTDSFFDLGGHSLLITQILVQIKKIINYNLTLQEFYIYPTIELLAKRIDNALMPELSYTHSILSVLDRDIHLGDSIDAPAAQATGSAIFVTGSTGFLGSYILKELIENTQATIYYLVQDNETSIQKSEKMLALFKGKRLFPIVGDLNKPKLGIPANIYELLSDSVSTIIHAAADIHHLYAYQQVRQTNVMGSLEILRLAANRKLKKIHFISSMSSCFDINDERMIVEDFPKTYPTGTEGGYVISKWVSEKIFEAAINRGFNITIYRPSLLLESESNGEFNVDNNYLYLFVKGTLQTGVAPLAFTPVDGLPVDFVAKLVTSIAMSDQNVHSIYNLNHPHPISSDRIFEWLNELGAHLKFVPYTKWKDDVLTHVTKDNAFYPLLSFYMNMPRSAHVVQEGRPLSVNAHTAEFLNKISLSYPDLDIKHFAFLIQNALDSIKRG